jgi:tungstate transport system substrate-binding protein
MCSAPTSAKLPKACRVFTSLAANELRPNNPGVWVKIESALKRANQGHRIGRFSRTAHMHSRRNTTLAFIALFGVTFFSAVQALAQEKSIVVASTTSTQDSGLFEYLLPIFQQKTGIAVKVIDQGTEQALDTGRRGDAFVHAKSAEEKFLAEGQGVKRYPVMYNDFILIGPKSDPAGIKGKDVIKAFRTIKEKQAPFVSRGDRSGTHIAELALWNKDAGIEIEKEKGTWYKSIGQGMGAALNMASASNAYVLSDRGTWLSFKNKCDLQIIVEGDKRLFNQYGVILVNPEKHPSVKKDLGQQFIDWLVSLDGQIAIANYKINGEQLFHPNADDPNA